MIETLISLLIWLIIVVVVAALVIWVVGRFLPEFATPVRYVVGAVVLIIVLLMLLQILSGSGLPSLR